MFVQNEPSPLSPRPVYGPNAWPSGLKKYSSAAGGRSRPLMFTRTAPASCERTATAQTKPPSGVARSRPFPARRGASPRSAASTALKFTTSEIGLVRPTTAGPVASESCCFCCRSFCSCVVRRTAIA